MTENYVTLLDSLYIPQFLSLHSSMERHVPCYVLWAVCVDTQSFDSLTKLALDNVKCINLIDYENERLLVAKQNRSRGEYCWTLTPFSFDFVFSLDPDVQRLTYLDADMWFLDDPWPIFNEFEASGKAVLMTEHGYSPEYDQSSTSGKYCVQFLTVVRGECDPVIKWWQDRCIEWCYNRIEDNKFGDQKYLEEWPKLFSGLTHVLTHKGFTLAPWNVLRFPYSEALIFHFHGVKFVNKKYVQIGGYKTPEIVLKIIYNGYFEDLKRSVSLMDKNDILFLPQASRAYNFGGVLKAFLFTIKSLIAQALGNIHKI